jgi:hypothetical protein
MYYVTIIKNGVDVFRRKPFKQYEDAMSALGEYYKTPWGKSTLTFVTETLNGQFARTYTELNRWEDIDPKDARYTQAVKDSNAFVYDGSYFFLIESEIGMQEADAFFADDDDE